jgi:hypothetical protein
MILSGQVLKYDDKLTNRDGLPEELTTEEWQAVMSFVDWYKEVKPTRIIAVEVSAINPELGYGGTIDLICEIDGQMWIIDFKTSNFGWKLEKKQDESIRSQLVYYKNFWSKKANIPFQDIRCGFLILKRTGKAGNKCDFFSVSVGDKTSSRSLKVLNNMISSVKKGVAIKNRDSCKYCDFNNTDHCKSF